MFLADHAVELPNVEVVPAQVARRNATPAHEVRLNAEAMSVVRAWRRVTITCIEGVLWITEDWNPVDVMLRPGENFESTNAGRIIITALEPSSYRTNIDRTPQWHRPWRVITDRMGFVFRVLRARSRVLAPRPDH